jgi:hypothetical protein
MSKWEEIADGLFHGKAPRQNAGWRFLWRVPGSKRGRSTRTLSLGSELEITREDAIRLASHARKLLSRGFDPIVVRREALTHMKRYWDSHDPR